MTILHLSSQLTIRITQRVIVAVLDKHIGILDLHTVDVLANDDDREGMSDNTFQVSEEVSDLGGQEGGEFWQPGLHDGTSVLDS